MTVDELIIKLGLDASGFAQGAKDANEATRKLKDNTVKDATSAEEAVAKVGKGVEALGRKFLSLYAIFTAGKGLGQFVSDITSADAALGRTSRNVDMSAKALSAWQGAATVAGGSAEGITSNIAKLSGEMQTAALTGTSSVIPAFRALGINLADAGGKARDVGSIFLDLADRAQSMDPARFTAFAHMIGLDDGTIALLEKGRVAVDALLTEQRKYAATAADADAAQKRQSGWRDLLITSASIGRTILTSLTPAIVGAMKAVQDWAAANEGWIKTAIVERVGEFVKYLQGLDWNAVGEGFKSFASNIASIAESVASALKGIDANSPLTKALEALAVLAGTRLVLAFTGLGGAIGKLSTIALPGWFARLLANPAVVGAAAVALGASAESTPGAGVPEDATERAKVAEENRRLTDEGNRKQGYTGNLLSDTFTYFKRKLGFGDDAKTKDDISDTAKATGEIRDLMKADKDKLGAGIGMDTASGGGRGEYGGHSGAPSIRYGRQHDSRGGSAPVPAFKLTGNQAAQLGDGIRLAAQHLGIKPEDLGTVISYETGGTMDPWQPGPHTKWGHHHGLIQWGEPQAKQYGVTKDSTIGQQMAAVERYLRDAGVKPGMGILDVYSAVNAGRVGKYGASDGYGTVSSHVDRMIGSAHRTALARLDSAAKGGLTPGATTTPATPAAAAPDQHYTDPNAPGVVHLPEFEAADKLLRGRGGTPAQRAAAQKVVDRWNSQSFPQPGLVTQAGQDSAAGVVRSTATKPDTSDHTSYPTLRVNPKTGRADTSGAPEIDRSGPTVGDAARHVLHLMQRAGRLGGHDGPVPVTMDERGAKHINEALRRRATGAGRAHYNHDIDRAMGHAAALHRMTRIASAAASGGHHVSNVGNTSMDVRGVTIHSHAATGEGIMADLRNGLELRKPVAQANTGLA